jgi:hypothetical protein
MRRRGPPAQDCLADAGLGLHALRAQSNACRRTPVRSQIADAARRLRLSVAAPAEA